MGKKYDAYEKAVTAEGAAKSRYEQEPTEQNRIDAEQAEKNANFLFDKMLMDPEG